MATLDRSEFIELLQRLGAESDEDALAAARSLHRAILESGMTWDDLLVPDSPPSKPDADDEDETGDAADDEEGDEDEDEDDVEEEEEEEEEEDASATREPAASHEDAARAIERLLADKTLSQETRDELAGFQRDLAEGRLTAMDGRYIAALARRLGA
jgi:hypothetical protein